MNACSYSSRTAPRRQRAGSGPGARRPGCPPGRPPSSAPTGGRAAGRPPIEARPRDRLVLRGRRARQVLVVVRPGLVVVVERGQVGVVEEVGELPELATRLEAQLPPPVELPAAAPALLVLPALRVADAGLRLDVVEPDVLGARPVRPHVLAGDRARVAADALVEAHHHPDLRPDPHQYATSFIFRTTTISSRCGPVGP